MNKELIVCCTLWETSVFFSYFILVKVQFSAFSLTTPHHPSHLHFPPLVISYLKLLLGEASCLR